MVFRLHWYPWEVELFIKQNKKHSNFYAKMNGILLYQMIAYSLIMIFKNYSGSDGLLVDHPANLLKHDLIVYTS